MNRIKYLIIATVFSMSVGFISAQSIEEGRRLTRNEQYEDAEKMFNDLIAKSPKKGDAYYWAGINYLERGDSTAAADVFSKGLANSPKYLLNYVGQGHLKLREGNNAEADALFAMAMKSKKKMMPLVNREIARAYLMVEDRKKAILVNNAEKALYYLDKAGEDDFEVLLLQGDALFRKNPADGTSPINKYILAGYINGQSPLPLLRQAMIYQRTTNYDISMIRVDEALSLDAGYAPGYRQKAELYADMKKRDSAVIFYREYLKRNNNLSARRRFVNALFFNGQLDEAIKEAKELLKVKEFTNLYGVIAYAIADKGDTTIEGNQEGLKYFELYEQKHVSKLNRPLSAGENFYKGTLMVRSGQKEAGFAQQLIGLKDTAGAILRWYDQAREYYYGQKEFDKAIEILKLKSSKMGETAPTDMYYLAMSYRGAGKYQKSNEVFSAIVAKDSTYTKGYYLMALNEHLMDPIDSTGNVSKAYYYWMGKLKGDDIEKNKKEIENAYRSMADFSDKKAAAAYASAEDKANKFPKTIEYYKNSIELYKKVLTYSPNDEKIKSWVETLEKFVASLEKRRGAKR